MNARAFLPALAVTLLSIAGCATPPRPTAAAPAVQALPSSPAPSLAASPTADEARRAEFDAALTRWHGAPLSELRAKLGKPDAATRRGDGRTAYAFTRSRPTGAGNDAGRFSCTVRYIVDDRTQRVQSHEIEGC